MSRICSPAKANPCFISIRSRSVTFVHLIDTPNSPQRRSNFLLQVGSLGKLLFQLRSKPLHLLLKRLSIIFDFFSPYVVSRCNHVAVLLDSIQRGGFPTLSPSTSTGQLLVRWVLTQ